MIFSHAASAVCSLMLSFGRPARKWRMASELEHTGRLVSSPRNGVGGRLENE